ncbi:MAG TPA: hypothetical protein VGO80_19575 [Solirubrobacteraceae bacterium]|nr:hypothetical protein [Solirubrobacteraceae bacterium]
MQILAIIGLLVGLVVLLVVIKLLNDTLSPLRAILADVQGAHGAPLLERGVPGTEQLGQTRRLAESVPPLALAYLNKLGANPYAAPPPPPPAAAAPVAAAPAPQAQPASPQSSQPEPPAWKKYITK